MNKFYQNENICLYCGDVLETLKTLDSESVQCCITSPPYYGLRNYGVDGQLGIESTPFEYIDKILVVFDELKRILKKDGTLWLNIGDSYVSKPTGSLGNFTGEAYGFGKSHKHQNAGTERIDKTGFGIPEKNLIGIPWRIAFGLQDRNWILRQDIIWEKLNPMPESVKSRCTKAHEYLFLLSKRQDYYFNHEAIQEKTSIIEDEVDLFGFKKETQIKTRNKRSVWQIANEPYKGEHVAPFPTKLVEPCILAGSRESDTVIDIFNGSGTTGLVAIKYGRKYIGIDINEKFLHLTLERLNISRDNLL